MKERRKWLGLVGLSAALTVGGTLAFAQGSGSVVEPGTPRTYVPAPRALYDTRNETRVPLQVAPNTFVNLTTEEAATVEIYRDSTGRVNRDEHGFPVSEGFANPERAYNGPGIVLNAEERREEVVTVVNRTFRRADPLVLMFRPGMPEFIASYIPFSIDGIKLEMIGWLGGNKTEDRDGKKMADFAFLVHDLEITIPDPEHTGEFINLSRKNGTIDSGVEMFGDTYADRSFESGFAALKTLDLNDDNVFDARDAAYPELRLWVDQWPYGLCDASSELFTLPEMGVSSISLDSKKYYIPVVSPAGSFMTDYSDFTYLNPVSGKTNLMRCVDIWWKLFRYQSTAQPVEQ